LKSIRYILLSSILTATLIACGTAKKATTANKPEFASETQRLEFESAFYQGNKEKIIGNNKDAARYFAMCLRISPNNPAASYELAMIALKTGDNKTAEFLAAIACKGDPENKWYQLLYAEVLMNLKKYKQAQKQIEELIRLEPENPENYLLQINCLLMENNLKGAIKEYDRLEKLTGVSEEISLQKERIYIQLQKFDLAVAELQKLIDSDPNEVRYHTLLAELYLANSMNAKALECYEKARKIDPGNPYLHYSLADYYRRNNNNEQYFNELKEVFINRGFDSQNKIKTIAPYYNLGDSDKETWKKVCELLDILVNTHPDDASVFAVRGDFYLREKNYVSAREMYRRSAELDKSNYSVYNQLMLVDSQLNDFENLSRDAVKASELFPQQALPYLMGGMAYIQKKNYDKAVDILKKGIDFVIDNNNMLTQFYANLGDAYYQLKNYSQSDSSFDKALAINPDDTYVLNNYSYYLSLRKSNLEKAEKMSKKTLELDPGNPSYMDTYGWIMYCLQRFTDAKLWIEKALDKDGNKNPVLLEHYGDILYKMDMKSQALEFWIKAKESGTGSDFLENKIKEKKLIE